MCCNQESVKLILLKLAHAQMVEQLVKFHVLADEDSNNQIGGFLELCDMLKMNGV